MLAAIPLLYAPVLAYALLAATLGGGLWSRQAGARLTAPLWTMSTASGGLWAVSAGVWGAS